MAYLVALTALAAFGGNGGGGGGGDILSNSSFDSSLGQCIWRPGYCVVEFFVCLPFNCNTLKKKCFLWLLLTPDEEIFCTFK